MKIISLLLFTLFIISILTSVVHAQHVSNVKHLTIPKIIPTNLNWNGIVDDEIWNDAAKIESFENNNKGQSLNEETTVYIFYDDEALYIAFHCKDRDIQSTYTKHDADLWDEEVMEFFVYPHETIPNPIGYFELQWNPLGSVFDGLITNHMDKNGTSKKRELSRDWNAEGMKHVIHVEGTLNQSKDLDKHWSGEIKIPFQTLGQKTPKQNDIWRANFYRYSRNVDETLTHIAWNPTHSTFHEPNRFGKLIFQ